MSATDLDSVLDLHYYERGIEARRSAHRDFTDVTDLLDDIEDRADQLLAELAGILDDVSPEHTPRRSTQSISCCRQPEEARIERTLRTDINERFYDDCAFLLFHKGQTSRTARRDHRGPITGHVRIRGRLTTPSIHRI